MPFKKTLVFLIIVLAAGGWGWVYGLPSLARTQIDSYLSAAGYKPHHIGEIIVRPPHILARNIQLDTDGFNTIGLLRAKVRGIHMDMEEVRIDDVRTSSTVETLPALLDLITTFQKSLPPGVVHLEKLVADFATPYGDLRLETTLNLGAANPDGRRAFGAVVRAQQYQLSFDSRWRGTLGADGAMNLGADILDGRLNIGPARLARLAGWLAWDSQTGQLPRISGQIDAGSGTLFGLPLQNISLAMGPGPNNATDVIFRTGLSGIANVLLSMDSSVARDNTSFAASLDIKESDAFFTHIQTLHTKAVPDTLRTLGPVRVNLDYRAERRFEGGPIPFALSAYAHNTPVLSGNILFYSDTTELRGSAEMPEALAIALQDYFSIAADKRTGGALRLDGSLDEVLKDRGDTPPAP